MKSIIKLIVPFIIILLPIISYAQVATSAQKDEKLKETYDLYYSCYTKVDEMTVEEFEKTLSQAEAMEKSYPIHYKKYPIMLNLISAIKYFMDDNKKSSCYEINKAIKKYNSLNTFKSKPLKNSYKKKFDIDSNSILKLKEILTCK